MMSSMGDFNDDIDWGVYKGQQKVPTSSGKSMADTQEEESPYRKDISLDKQGQEGDSINTFLGKMPKNIPQFKSGTSENRELIGEMIGAAIGSPGMQSISKLAPAAKEVAKKGVEYLQPGKASEKFRETLGSGTTKENIENLGKRVQFAKQSAKEEALIPKRELYSQEGRSNVYDVSQKSLPEGNLDKLGHMIEPGGRFSEGQMNSLSKALKDYRKTGKVDSFLDRSEEIFNIPELPEKAASKIEDALLMPTKRDSAYFSEEGVTDYYGKRGLKTLHDKFAEKPILSNYDSLQSAIKKEMRKLENKGKSLDTAGEEKLSALKTNVKNLDADKESFMKTLPENMQNLENQFRTKYAKGVGKYESAPLAMRKLAEGKWSEVTGDQVAKLFTNPTKETMGILKDLGPSAGKNILYNALQKVPLGDAEGLAKTILDLKRTKGYDKFVTDEMENWANNMMKHVGRASFIKKALTSGGGATAGAVIGGVPGAIIGGTLPWGWKGAKFLAEKLKK